MTERILDIADQGARLSVRLDQLIIAPHEDPEMSIPLEEVATLIVSHKAVSYTHAVLAGLAAHGGVLVACDARHMPAAMMLPLAGHHRHSERHRLQARAKAPTHKQAWRQIVQAKVGLQGRILRDFRGVDGGLIAMAGRVRSGDPDNVEGQAARIYWPLLFDDPEFRRDPEREDANRFLNYGYGVLRATIARAICGAGLHPSLGIHHHNRYDPFPLADDLMEPFRPIVDRAALHYASAHGPDAPLDKACKAWLIGSLMQRFEMDGEQRNLFDIASRLAASLAAIYEGERRELALPEI